MAFMPPLKPFDSAQIRKIAVSAIAADDILFASLVLKGGNALELAYGIGQRASFDLDFSIECDFEDPANVSERLERSLKDRFDAAGYVVFDYEFKKKPRVQRPGQSPRWGGYEASFKLISRGRWNELGTNIDGKRREAVTTGDGQQRIYRIDISKYEYCEGKIPTTIDEYTCYVYTPAMIATEKMRAICQQMPEYRPRSNPAPRPRDFYDIQAVVEATGMDLLSPSNVELARRVFEAKEVPWGLLLSIRDHAGMHEAAWSEVELAVRGEVKPFAFYLDFVATIAEQLHTLGVK